MDFSKYRKVTVGFDCVVLTSDLHKQENNHRDPLRAVQVLLIKRSKDPYSGMWALPGGLVEEGQKLTDTLEKRMKAKINLTNDCYMEQLYTYADNLNRDPRGMIISISYIMLLNKNKATNLKSGRYGEIKWFWLHLDEENKPRIIDTESGNELTELAFDHKDIIKDALIRLRNKAYYTDVLYHIMPEKFTIAELQNVFEEVIGKTIYSFRRFVGKNVIETKEYTEQRAHRPAMLYKYAYEMKGGHHSD